MAPGRDEQGESLVTQWTIGQKLYSGIGITAVVVIAMVAGARYAQSTLSETVGDLSLTIGPNIRYAGELRFLGESFTSASSNNILLAAQADAIGLEENRKKMEAIHAAFMSTAHELERTAPDQELKDLARQFVVVMDAFAAKGMAI